MPAWPGKVSCALCALGRPEEPRLQLWQVHLHPLQAQSRSLAAISAQSPQPEALERCKPWTFQHHLLSAQQLAALFPCSAPDRQGA